MTAVARQQQPDPIVKLIDVHVTLNSSAGPVQILRGIDLEIERGDTVSVVGPSGAGKSTMMMIMAGLENPSHGSVRVASHELTEMNEDDLARFRRDHVGIVFQAFHLIPTMTALENVAIPLEFAGRKDAFDRAREELVMVGLGHRLGHYPSQLSGGEQQRVALARALAPAAISPCSYCTGDSPGINVRMSTAPARKSRSTSRCAPWPAPPRVTGAR